MPKRLKLRDLTIPEVNRCLELCNFTDEELQLFNLKVKDKSTIEIKHEMHISESKIANISRRVFTKVKKILE